MQKLIKNHSEGRGGVGNTTGRYEAIQKSFPTFLGPVKEIENGEQFVPLFSAVPPFTKYYFGRGASSSRAAWRKTNTAFPSKDMGANAFEVLVNMNPTVAAEAELAFRSARELVVGARSFLYTKFFPYFTTTLILQKGVLDGVVTPALMKRLKEDFKKDKDFFKEIIKRNLKEYLSLTSQNQEAAFGFIQDYSKERAVFSSHSTLSGAPRNADEAIARLSREMQLCPWYATHVQIKPGVIQQPGEIKMTSHRAMLVRYNFIAEIGTKAGMRTACAIPNTILEQNLGNTLEPFGRPELSPWYGVNCYGSVVVKAKHRNYIAAMAMCNMEDKINLPSTDLQVWIQEGIGESFGREKGEIADMATARELFGIGEKAKVKIVLQKDLNKELLGESKTANISAVKDILSYNKEVLEKARVVADTEEENPESLGETLHSL